jgi:thioredoxin 1
MVKHLTLDEFKKNIFNFEENKDWKFEGQRPALIDFYADWCGPCKAIAPVLEELASEYGDKIDIYKVNTEKEMDLAGMFGIRSIPSLLFIPQTEQPQMVNGAISKGDFEKIFADVLGVQK